VTEIKPNAAHPNGRLLLFGDSIAMGLGVRQQKYGELIAHRLDMELVDYSNTGWTVSQSLSAFEREPVAGTVAVIAHGITEPILRPVLPKWLPLPARWRRLGWMDPRPYFSTRKSRRAAEILESEIRWRLKNVLARLFGTHQLASLPTYSKDLRLLKESCEGLGARVIILGPPDIDDRYFPGSVYEQLRYGRITERIAGADFVPVAGVVDRWGDYLADHFHPNDYGHQVIAELILEHIHGTREDGSPPGSAAFARPSREDG